VSGIRRQGGLRHRDHGRCSPPSGTSPGGRSGRAPGAPQCPRRVAVALRRAALASHAWLTLRGSSFSNACRRVALCGGAGGVPPRGGCAGGAGRTSGSSSLCGPELHPPAIWCGAELACRPSSSSTAMGATRCTSPIVFAHVAVGADPPAEGETPRCRRGRLRPGLTAIPVRWGCTAHHRGLRVSPDTDVDVGPPAATDEDPPTALRRRLRLWASSPSLVAVVVGAMLLVGLRASGMARKGPGNHPPSGSRGWTRRERTVSASSAPWPSGGVVELLSSCWVPCQK